MYIISEICITNNLGVKLGVLVLDNTFKRKFTFMTDIQAINLADNGEVVVGVHKPTTRRRRKYLPETHDQIRGVLSKVNPRISVDIPVRFEYLPHCEDIYMRTAITLNRVGEFEYEVLIFEPSGESYVKKIRITRQDIKYLYKPEYAWNLIYSLDKNTKGLVLEIRGYAEALDMSREIFERYKEQ